MVIVFSLSSDSFACLERKRDEFFSKKLTNLRKRKKRDEGEKNAIITHSHLPISNECYKIEYGTVEVFP